MKAMPLPASESCPDPLDFALEQARQNFHASIGALARVSARQSTVRGHMAQSPWHWLLAAAGGGFVLGWMRSSVALQRRRG